MNTYNKEAAIEKISVMPKEQVAKVLIFMAGMEAERDIKGQNTASQPRKPPKQTA